MAWLRCLDVALTCLHLVVIGAVTTLWAFRRTRRLHLWIVAGVALSWFGLGLRYGIGYCPLTDWHWRVKRALGETELPGSFVQYTAEWLAGRPLPNGLVDGVTMTTLVAAIALSLWQNLGSTRAD